MRNILSMVVCLALSIMVGCGPKPIKQESLLDTPEYHYSLGAKYLEDRDYEKAAQEFNRAKALNLKYCLAYIGLGLVEAETKNFKKAFSLMEEAKDLAETKIEKVESFIGMGRVISLKRAGDDWLEDACQEFKEALKIDSSNSKIYYFRGIAYEKAYQFSKSGDDFRKVLNFNTLYLKEANEEWAKVQKIERAAPGTMIGKKIALLEETDRSDIAALFIAELNLDRFLRKRMPEEVDTSFKAPQAKTALKSKSIEVPKITDVNDHWAKNYIEEVVKYGIIPTFPDHTFKPDELITKTTFCKMILDLIVVITGEYSLETKFIGSTSPFKDVRSDHFAFPAIMVTTTRGIIEPKDKINGLFGGLDKVSGPEALLVLRNLKTAMQW
ncbi:S-layer homology domain-containing protein [bacterium]|nr:S-layer homology domain-containing protein [bacterium]MBU1153877.1 S-layer homology domain-containing protein [bacterium]MBU1782402.1 S-layer homology domain-containing protein [bacterium]